MKHYNTLVNLAELATEKSNGKNTYNVVDNVFGYIPFKNEENLVEKVGSDFHLIAQWLLNELEN